MKKSAKKAKVKPVKRKSKSGDVSEAQMPGLVEAMFKLTERLEAVERKMDLVVNHTSSRQQHQPPAKPSFPNPPRQEHRQPQHNHPNQNRQNQPHQNFSRPPQNQNHPQNQGGGRPMFQTTCADCGKGCEVPFKPTGERPIYCKECYGLRKSGGQSQNQVPPAPQIRAMERRELKVVKNGVGRTVISEMVEVSERQSHPAKKSSKPAKKSKR